MSSPKKKVNLKFSRILRNTRIFSSSSDDSVDANGKSPQKPNRADERKRRVFRAPSSDISDLKSAGYSASVKTGYRTRSSDWIVSDNRITRLQVSKEGNNRSGRSAAFKSLLLLSEKRESKNSLKLSNSPPKNTKQKSSKVDSPDVKKRSKNFGGVEENGKSSVNTQNSSENSSEKSVVFNDAPLSNASGCYQLKADNDNKLIGCYQLKADNDNKWKKKSGTLLMKKSKKHADYSGTGSCKDHSNENEEKEGSTEDSVEKAITSSTPVDLTETCHITTGRVVTNVKVGKESKNKTSNIAVENYSHDELGTKTENSEMQADHSRNIAESSRANHDKSGQTVPSSNRKRIRRVSAAFEDETTKHTYKLRRTLSSPENVENPICRPLHIVKREAARASVKTNSPVAESRPLNVAKETQKGCIKLNRNGFGSGNKEEKKSSAQESSIMSKVSLSSSFLSEEFLRESTTDKYRGFMPVSSNTEQPCLSSTKSDNPNVGYASAKVEDVPTNTVASDNLKLNCNVRNIRATSNDQSSSLSQTSSDRYSNESAYIADDSGNACRYSTESRSTLPDKYCNEELSQHTLLTNSSQSKLICENVNVKQLVVLQELGAVKKHVSHSQNSSSEHSDSDDGHRNNHLPVNSSSERKHKDTLIKHDETTSVAVINAVNSESSASSGSDTETTNENNSDTITNHTSVPNANLAQPLEYVLSIAPLSIHNTLKDGQSCKVRLGRFDVTHEKSPCPSSDNLNHSQSEISSCSHSKDYIQNKAANTKDTNSLSSVHSPKKIKRHKISKGESRMSQASKSQNKKSGQINQNLPLSELYSGSKEPENKSTRKLKLDSAIPKLKGDETILKFPIKLPVSSVHVNNDNGKTSSTNSTAATISSNKKSSRVMSTKSNTSVSDIPRFKKKKTNENMFKKNKEICKNSGTRPSKPDHKIAVKGNSHKNISKADNKIIKSSTLGLSEVVKQNKFYENLATLQPLKKEGYLFQNVFHSEARAPSDVSVPKVTNFIIPKLTSAKNTTHKPEEDDSDDDRDVLSIYTESALLGELLSNDMPVQRDSVFPKLVEDKTTKLSKQLKVQPKRFNRKSSYENLNIGNTMNKNHASIIQSERPLPKAPHVPPSRHINTNCGKFKEIPNKTHKDEVVTSENSDEILTTVCENMYNVDDNIEKESHNHNHLKGDSEQDKSKNPKNLKKTVNMYCAKDDNDTDLDYELDSSDDDSDNNQNKNNSCQASPKSDPFYENQVDNDNITLDYPSNENFEENSDSFIGSDENNMEDSVPRMHNEDVDHFSDIEEHPEDNLKKELDSIESVNNNINSMEGRQYFGRGVEHNQNGSNYSSPDKHIDAHEVENHLPGGQDYVNGVEDELLPSRENSSNGVENVSPIDYDYIDEDENTSPSSGHNVDRTENSLSSESFYCEEVNGYRMKQNHHNDHLFDEDECSGREETLVDEEQIGRNHSDVIDVYDGQFRDDNSECDISDDSLLCIRNYCPDFLEAGVCKTRGCLLYHMVPLITVNEILKYQNFLLDLQGQGYYTGFKLCLECIFLNCDELGNHSDNSQQWNYLLVTFESWFNFPFHYTLCEIFTVLHEHSSERVPCHSTVENLLELVVNCGVVVETWNIVKLLLRRLKFGCTGYIMTEYLKICTSSTPPDSMFCQELFETMITDADDDELNLVLTEEIEKYFIALVEHQIVPAARELVSRVSKLDIDKLFRRKSSLAKLYYELSTPSVTFPHKRISCQDRKIPSENLPSSSLDHSQSKIEHSCRNVRNQLPSLAGPSHARMISSPGNLQKLPPSTSIIPYQLPSSSTVSSDRLIFSSPTWAQNKMKLSKEVPSKLLPLSSEPSQTRINFMPGNFHNYSPSSSTSFSQSRINPLQRNLDKQLSSSSISHQISSAESSQAYESSYLRNSKITGMSANKENPIKNKNNLKLPLRNTKESNSSCPSWEQALLHKNTMFLSQNVSQLQEELHSEVPSTVSQFHKSNMSKGMRHEVNDVHHTTRDDWHPSVEVDSSSQVVKEDSDRKRENEWNSDFINRKKAKFDHAVRTTSDKISELSYRNMSTGNSIKGKKLTAVGPSNKGSKTVRNAVPVSSEASFDKPTLDDKLKRLTRMIRSKLFCEAVEVIINEGYTDDWESYVRCTFAALRYFPDHALMFFHNLLTKTDENNLERPYVHEFLATLGVNLIWHLLSVNNRDSAYYIYNAMRSSDLDTIAPQILAEKVSLAGKVLKYCEMALKMAEPLLSVDMLQNYEMFKPAYEEWNILAEENDIETRNAVCEMLLENLMGERPLNALELFMKIFSDQKDLEEPICISQYYNSIMCYLIDNNKYEEAVAFFLLDDFDPGKIPLERDCRRGLLSLALQQDERDDGFINDILESAIDRGIYPSFEKVVIPHVLIISCTWTKEEINVLIKKYFEHLKMYYVRKRSKDDITDLTIKFETSTRYTILGEAGSVPKIIRKAFTHTREMSMVMVKNSLKFALNLKFCVNERKTEVVVNKDSLLLLLSPSEEE